MKKRPQWPFFLTRDFILMIKEMLLAYFVEEACFMQKLFRLGLQADDHQFTVIPFHSVHNIHQNRFGGRVHIMHFIHK